MLPLKSSIEISLIIEAFHGAIQNESILLFCSSKLIKKCRMLKENQIFFQF
jgi:hypothetical protein